MRPAMKISVPFLRILFLFAVGLSVLLFSCSSAPKEVEPDTPAAGEAAKYAEFGNSFFNQARYPQAVEMYRLALNRYIRIDNQRGAVSAYNALAKTFLAMGNTEEAELMLQSSIRVLKSLSPFNPEDSGIHSAVAETYGNYGELEYIRGDYTQALDWFDQGLTLVSAESGPDGYAILMHNRGTALHKLERETEARQSINEALEINLANDNLYEIASNYYMLAVLDLNADSVEGALEHALKALTYDRSTENSPGIGQDLFLLARIEDSRGNTEKADGYLDRAEAIFHTIGFTGTVEAIEEYRKLRTEK